MHRWISLFLLVLFLALPPHAGAQSEIALSKVSVQLWPEYDQPSMLVIYDLTLDEQGALPAELPVRIPLDATLIAVAYEQDGSLLNARYQEPYVEGDWQVVVVAVEARTTYHLEYYTPLGRVEQQRDYEYLWPGGFATDEFVLRLRVPVDTIEVVTEPPMAESAPAGGEQAFMEWSTTGLGAGQQVPVSITYVKTSERLATSGAELQTGQVDGSTAGRVSLDNYLIYILGVLGVFLILASGYYFWRSGLRPTRPRRRGRAGDGGADSEQVYCHQCGKRAQPGDRFCRTCGTRLRREN